MTSTSRDAHYVRILRAYAAAGKDSAPQAIERVNNKQSTHNTVDSSVTIDRR